MTVAERIAAAIAAGENMTDDRRKLLIVGSLVSVAVLKAGNSLHGLWVDPPPCFVGHPSIVGSFAGVPVAQKHLEGMPSRGFALMLGDRLLSVIEF